MLTIRMMARFGPWTFLRVEDLMHDKSRWEHCERCDEHIRYVHVCQVDGESKEWRIGSTCGPTLIEVSEVIWDATAKVAERNLKLLHRAIRLKPLEAGETSWAKATSRDADWIDKVVALLESGTTDGHTLTRSYRANDLDVIKLWLRLAEKSHELAAYKMGQGR